MTTHTRFTLIAGALAAASLLAGCQRDRAAGPTGPGPINARPAGGEPTPPRTQTLFDGTAADGRHYTVQRVFDASGTVVAADHFIDGVLFAETTPVTQGVTVSAYDGGTLVESQPVSVTDLSLTVQSATFIGGSQDIMIMQCMDEISAYLTASGGLIAAGAFLQRNRGSKKAIGAFTTALYIFIGAWNDLYNCEVAASRN